MRAILLSFALAVPSLAEPIQGLDDPAFRAPFERALQGDDPTAMKEIHAAAEAGNQAAILAFPVISDWLRKTLPFAERKKLTRINDLPMAEAFAAADPVAALWALGDTGGAADLLLARAFALYDAGEPDKATLLFMTWVNQTGGYQPLPSDFFDHPVPAWAMAQVLRGRLIDSGFGTLAEGEALVVERLKADDPAALMALASFVVHANEAYIEGYKDRLNAILIAAEVPLTSVEQEMKTALAAQDAVFRRDTALDLATAEVATAIFRNEPGFQSLIGFCAAACPATADACTNAFVAGFGHPYGRATMAQPLTSLISTEDFFATARGQLILLRSTHGALGDDPAASPALAAARQIDACLADAVLSSLP